jgi:CRISPR-associated protein Cas1
MVDRVVVDLSHLPRVADGLSFLYAEHVRVERTQYAIELVDKEGRVPVPVAALGTLLLGPGSTITHAAVVALAECGASIVWCGEGLARCYAAGLGETRRGKNLEAQARAWASPKKHLEVVRALYAMRFDDPLPENLTLEQIRGHEGVRVRDTYAHWSEVTGVPWSGRAYRQGDWASADPVNRALSAANACLYGVCHAAIVATGFCPGLGFVHVGKQLSFVYDVADLYKMDLTVPAAFLAAAGGATGIEARARRATRERVFEENLLERIVPDIQSLFGLAREKVRVLFHRPLDHGKGPTQRAVPIVDEQSGVGAAVEDTDDAVGDLWNEDGSVSAGGKNFGPDEAGLLDFPLPVEEPDSPDEVDEVSDPDDPS